MFREILKLGVFVGLVVFIAIQLSLWVHNRVAHSVTVSFAGQSVEILTLNYKRDTLMVLGDHNPLQYRCGLGRANSIYVFENATGSDILVSVTHFPIIGENTAQTINLPQGHFVSIGGDLSYFDEAMYDYLVRAGNC
ncbi:MAG: hypothetical protein QY314_03450 [Candidatus Dojkabacteria bacterium]|nr:MAG: hypothetical protein QY314_03450 [Candidatus Dojkabacteria bacterium]